MDKDWTGAIVGHGHALLEVASWVAALLGALALTVAAATWLKDRWVDIRTNPYGLRLSLDVAVGDAGHVVHLLNQRASPVTVQTWGVMPHRQAPRLFISRIVPANRVDSRALYEIADINSARPLVQVDSGQYLYLRTVTAPEDVLTPEQARTWQSPTATRTERQQLEALMADQFSHDEPKCGDWPEGTKLVPFVQIPGVGYVFGKPTVGPFTVLGGYPGYPCNDCHHDWLEHDRRGHRAWRRLRLRAHRCTQCTCAKFTGQPQPPLRHDQFM